MSHFAPCVGTRQASCQPSDAITPEIVIFKIIGAVVDLVITTKRVFK